MNLIQLGLQSIINIKPTHLDPHKSHDILMSSPFPSFQHDSNVSGSTTSQSHEQVVKTSIIDTPTTATKGEGDGLGKEIASNTTISQDPLLDARSVSKPKGLDLQDVGRFN